MLVQSLALNKIRVPPFRLMAYLEVKSIVIAGRFVLVRHIPNILNSQKEIVFSLVLQNPKPC